MTETLWTRFTGKDIIGDVSEALNLPPAPPWRRFNSQYSGKTMRPSQDTVDMVNIALYLRRPLLITGKPGTGKSSLASKVAQELGLDDVLRWSISTRSTLPEGLYRYDALSRLQEIQRKRQSSQKPHDIAIDIGRYIRLGPLGTAFLPRSKPRVLLIDEIDKGDVDLPNDLLHVFEEGYFDIPELLPHRLGLEQLNDVKIDATVLTHDNKSVIIQNGHIQCTEFPFIIMTSNGERDFPPAFLRRCLRLEFKQPSTEALIAIVRAHVGDDVYTQFENELKAEIDDFITKRGDEGDLATDQLLKSVFRNYLSIRSPFLSRLRF